MRSRRTLTAGLLAAAVLAGCSGTAKPDPTSTPRPTDPVATTASSAATSPAAASPAATSPNATSPNAPTTLPVATAPSSTVATTAIVSTTTAPAASPTTTRQVITLPDGVTEADRAAAEAAALGWWEEFYTQLLALPDFDPQAILSRTVPGKPAGPDMLAALEERKANNFAFRPGAIHQTVLLDTRFLSGEWVEIQVCVADDGVFVQEGTNKEELGGLGRSFFLARLRKSAAVWQVENWGSFRDSEDGVPCE